MRLRLDVFTILTSQNAGNARKIVLIVVSKWIMINNIVSQKTEYLDIFGKCLSHIVFDEMINSPASKRMLA